MPDKENFNCVLIPETPPHWLADCKSRIQSESGVMEKKQCGH